MKTPDMVGFIGVAIQLVAFLLNLLKIRAQDSRTYLLMNIIGAGLTCFSSILISFYPFVILKGTWTTVSIVALIFTFKKKKN